eukprot:5860659-Prymnesium_polylepis.1
MLLRRCSARRGLCSVADATAAILRSGEAGDGPSLSALEALTTALPPQPVSIAMLQGSARGESHCTPPEMLRTLCHAPRHAPPSIPPPRSFLPPSFLRSSVADRSQRTRLLNARFLKRELTARRAHVLSLLHAAPSPLAEQPAIARLTSVYWERLRCLLEMPDLERVGASACDSSPLPRLHKPRPLAPRPEDKAGRLPVPVAAGDEAGFASRMIEHNGTIQQQTPEEFKMVVDALAACRGGGERLPPDEQLAIDRQLDAVFLARVGMRFLLEHCKLSPRARGSALLKAASYSPLD